MDVNQGTLRSFVTNVSKFVCKIRVDISVKIEYEMYSILTKKKNQCFIYIIKYINKSR